MTTYLWDSLRWRFVAAGYIVWWLLRGAPLANLPLETRWKNTVLAWRLWRAVIMVPHERHKWKPVQHFIDELEA